MEKASKKQTIFSSKPLGVTAWRARDLDAVLDFFADEAQVKLSPPIAEHGLYSGKQEIRIFVAEHLEDNLRVEPIKHQVAGDRVTWVITAPPHRSPDVDNPVDGKAEAVV